MTQVARVYFRPLNPNEKLICNTLHPFQGVMLLPEVHEATFSHINESICKYGIR